MAYIGNPVQQSLTKVTSQSFNGTGSQTVFTLNRAVNTGEELEVFVENVQQEPGVGKSYTATGTTLTFDAAPQSGTGNIYVIYRGIAEVTRRLEHDPNAALAATTGTFSDDGGGSSVVHRFSNSGTTSGDNAVVRINVGGTTAGSFIQFSDSDDSNVGQIEYDHNNDAMVFDVNASEAMRINSSGNVGIGTTSPTADLTVSPANNEGAVRVGDNATYYGEMKRVQASDEVRIGSYGASQNLTFHTVNAERMRIDSSGRVTMPYQPSFAATRSQGSVSNAVYVYPNVYHNTGSHYNSSNGRFTAPVSGSYFIATNHMSENNNTYNNSSYDIRVNSVNVQIVYSSNGGNVHHRWSWAGVIYLNQNDYVDVYVQGAFQLYGQSGAYSQFSGYLLG